MYCINPNVAVSLSSQRSQCSLTKCIKKLRKKQNCSVAMDNQKYRHLIEQALAKIFFYLINCDFSI